MSNHYDWKNSTQTCPSCGWAGLGSQSDIGETFRDGAEYHCPKCQHRFGFIAYPLLKESIADPRAPESDRKFAELALRGATPTPLQSEIASDVTRGIGFVLSESPLHSKHQTKHWHSGLGGRLLYLVGYFTFAPAFVLIVLRALFDLSLQEFLQDFGILALVCLGLAMVFVGAAWFDHRNEQD